MAGGQQQCRQEQLLQHPVYDLERSEAEAEGEGFPATTIFWAVSTVLDIWTFEGQREQLADQGTAIG